MYFFFTTVEIYINYVRYLYIYSLLFLCLYSDMHQIREAKLVVRMVLV